MLQKHQNDNTSSLALLHYVHPFNSSLSNMKFLALVVFAIAFVAVSAKPGLLGGWWGGHGAVDPGAVVVGPAGSISVGPSSGGAVIPGAGWLGHGVWGHGAWGHGAWGPGLWGHHGLGW